ncbi:MAG: YccF domain-containing protein [Acidimicrobiaceae bacterium]|nr:YccF domain-containing protein [Acidimicrobiaceae bacterium]MBP6486171.1 YccF domain-containing protein [Ilumatobacteraceae bacterium]MBK9971809.1 YccF domain-containing protein [Acidimicrobiaceae bacterium]MBP7887895.1 YccF domain-containing protein [Ilumatobacteraceae bacterium]MBP9051878.1 YccF domain-containing protein [Ilumatobacteraceae bacterium]
MKVLGNVLWLVLAGWWLALAYVVAGVLNCITVIGIPFGLQSFKLAGYALWPFGRVVVDRPGASAAVGCVGNILWLVLGGLGLAISHVVAGLLLCVTIVGLPLGIASMKMSILALTPFGKQVVRADAAGTSHVVSSVPGY